MLNPAISVIIPTYNYAHYIVEAIESVIAENYPRECLEIIVVDDGSTDNTKEVLAEFIGNQVIKYYYQENNGKAGATYKAIQRSTGKYIFNLDADDYFLPGKIKETVRVFEAGEDIVHVATPAQLFSEDKNLILGNEMLPAAILETPLDGDLLLNYFYHNNILFGGGSTYAARSSVLKKIQIPEAVDMYIDEFLILAILPFGKSFFLKEPLSVWRLHKTNYSVGLKQREDEMIKGKRLLNASAAVLSYLRENKFDATIINIYRLKDLTRRMALKENLREKKLKDIIIYFYEVFFKILPGFKLIKRYHILNRLMPLQLYLFLKKLSGKDLYSSK